MRRAAAALFCLHLACTTPAPPLPAVALDRFQPAVREAVEKALREAQANPKDGGAAGRFGMVLHAHEQWGAARDAYLRARALDPGNFDWPYYLSDVYTQLGQADTARRAVEDALGIDASYTPAALRLAELMIDAGDSSGAAARFEKVLATEPESATAWYGLGRAQAGRNDPAAISSFERACRAFPDYGAAHYALALALRKAGRVAEAEPHLKIYEAQKTTAPPRNDTRQAAVLALNIGAANFIRQGVDREAQGDLAGAIAAHERALEVDAKSQQAHVNLIQLYARSGNAAQAEEHYKAAIALNPNLAEAHYSWGVFCFGRKDAAGAQRAFARTLEINPQHAQAHHNLGFLLESQGRMADAQRHYEQALAAQPDYRLAHFHLGRLLLQRGQAKEAIAHLEQTLEPTDESTPGFLYALGAAYARSGDLRKAALRLEEARTQALAKGQAPLVSAIDRDMARLPKPGTRP